jgi:predicted lipoprotein with Yx(FWY)xxD motif
MNRRLIFGGIAAAAVLGATGIGVAVADSSSHGAGPAAYGRPSGATASGDTVRTASTGLGQILVDGNGRTLYLFEKDSATNSTCYGACASAWPPATIAAAVHAGTGASAAFVGTVHRTDGTNQLSYNGHPLYYYAGDAKTGDTTGQGLLQFGAKWYVLDPNGAKIDND